MQNSLKNSTPESRNIYAGTMQTSKIAQVEVALQWKSEDATHCDRMFMDKVNFWRDVFPGNMAECLNNAEPGEITGQILSVEDLNTVRQASLIRTIHARQFNRNPRPGLVIEPRTGRFYPRTFLTGMTDYFPQDSRPFRLLEQDEEYLKVDLNHPFAGYPARLAARVIRFLDEKEEHGGRCNDIAVDIIQNGPGMQARPKQGETDFFTGSSLERMDNREDALFYRESRFVGHIDSLASAQIREIYQRFLQAGMRVLDLMSSWVSHLPAPETAMHLQVTGLGMNAAELDRNPGLQQSVVHDLNLDPVLPFSDNMFDLAICTVSVEYLTRPFAVFEHVARVLKPGAMFVVTFSDRWFPTKAINVWSEIHPFERMGLVLDYFRKSGKFTDLSTESIRGYPRPEDDKYAGSMALADPVYAVWGRVQKA